MFKKIGKYAGLAAGLGFLTAFASLALAQISTGNVSSPAKQAIMEQRKTQAVQNLATTTINQKLEAVQKRTEAAVQNLERIREENQGKLTEIREKVQNRIAEIKDEQKRKQAEQIENQYNHVNQVWTDHFANLLGKYEAILQKIKNRTDKAAANSKDVTEVDALIEAAETTLAKTRQAVETQAKKTYTISITAVNSGIVTATSASSQTQLIKNLREQFKIVKNQLENDLKALRDGAVKDAKTAIHDAFQALSQIPKVDEEPTSTSN